jgi:glutathione S-transferase
MLKLFYAPNACSLGAHIALEETGAPFEVARVDLKSGAQNQPEYRRINPKGRVPALVTDRGTLTESPAILGYIAETFPEARLAPLGDSFAMADMLAFNLFIASTLHVAFAHVGRPARYADGEVAHAAMKAKAHDALDEYFGLVEAKLSDGRPWVHGDAYTVSDPYLYVFSRWFAERGIGHPENFPLVAAHRERVAARPAAQRALATEGLVPAAAAE